MSDVCTVCGTFDDRCNCFAGGDSAGFPSSDVVAPSEAPTVTPPPGPVGATIVGESGYPVAQTPRPSYSDMADAVMFCAHFMMLREVRARKADPNPQTVRMLDRWTETAALALHAADVLRGLGEGAL